MREEDMRLTETKSSAAPSVLAALADRCEREEPSRELDADIYVVIVRGAYADETIEQRMTRAKSIGPSYTASLDAAMTLVPEGHCWSVSRRTHDKLASANVYKPTALRGFSVSPTHSEHSAPLALCAAALRARAVLLTNAAPVDK